MPGLWRLGYSLQYLRLFRLWFRFWFRRLKGSHFRRRLIPVQPPQLLLIQSLLEPCDPAATLFLFRHLVTNRLRLGRDGFDLGLFKLFEVDNYLFRRRTRSLRVGEKVECFAQSSALRPLDGIQTEIIALLRIGAGLNQSLNDMRVTKDYGEDERRLTAARSFIYVSAVGEKCRYRTFVAGSNG